MNNTDFPLGSAYTTHHGHRHDARTCNKCNKRRARYVVRQGDWFLTTYEPTHCRTCMRKEQGQA